MLLWSWLVAGSKKTGNMSEFWLISAPRDKENLQALKRMNTVTSKSNLSYNTKFTIPDFKVQFPGEEEGGHGLGWVSSGKPRRKNISKPTTLRFSLGVRLDRGVRMGLAWVGASRTVPN